MRKIAVTLINVSLALWSTVSYGAFNSGSTGADGPFNPIANTVVTLPPNGVLNYTTVNIPANVTVTFQKNAANTPVYMLASENVTISGAIKVDGSSTTNNTVIGAGGPGGFDGGYGGATSSSGGNGLGPGKGQGGPSASAISAGGGGYATPGGSYGNGNGAGGATYGTARLLPIIGGSGGGGSSGFSTSSGYGGGGGGGAILIASSGSIIVDGTITANGGSTYVTGTGLGGLTPWTYSGAGSGGAIKLVADEIRGNGTITAKGGNLSLSNKGGQGRIRLEAITIVRTASTDPPYTYGQPGSIFLSNMPSLAIKTIAAETPPTNPTGSYTSPDILLPSGTQNPVTVNIEATNIPTSTIVKVRVIPQYGADSSVDATLIGTDQASTASANVTLSTTYSNIVTAEATFTVVAMNYNGEQIDKVHVATTMGGKSEINYITKSGKIIEGGLVALAK